MNNFNRWAVIVGALLLAAVIGGIAYHVGVTQGLEQSGKIVTMPNGPHPYYYGHRPWGFFLVPLFFIAFWFLVVRGLFWRGRGPCGRGLDEWHRQAHERMWNDPSGTSSGGPTRA